MKVSFRENTHISETFMVESHFVDQLTFRALHCDVQNGLLGCGFSQGVFVLAKKEALNRAHMKPFSDQTPQ